VVVTQKTEKATAAPKALAAAKTDIKIDSVKLTWQAAPGANKHIIEVWSPNTKTEAPKLVQRIEAGGTATTATIGGLTAGTKYTFAVKAIDAGGKDLTAFAAKAITTAKYTAPKINLMKEEGIIPAYGGGIFTSANYTHYEFYYVDANKKEVCIGTCSIAPPAEKAKVNLSIGMLTPNDNFATFKTFVGTQGTKAIKFVVKAVTKVGDTVVNTSLGGSCSVKANLVNEEIKGM
jgi:hypothetical protein